MLGLGFGHVHFASWDLGHGIGVGSGKRRCSRVVEGVATCIYKPGGLMNGWQSRSSPL